jgi:flavin reductase (DIM6/NTAB) family NADH-FMN oxidoreductase RutF
MTTKNQSAEFDSLDLRQAFGCFGTGVTVITTRSPSGARAGVTANSFNTVSMDPPIVLWSLSRQSPSLAVFRAARHFAVNVLTAEQLALSNRFARPAADKFAGVDYADGLEDLPLLADCAATLECAVLNEQVVGDHVLFLGRVMQYAYRKAPPLLFFHGRYGQGIALNSSSAVAS